MVLETSLRFLTYLGFRQDDDWVDRLHNFLSSNMLLALAMLISWKQFGGKPIECMLPKMFPSSWEDSFEVRDEKLPTSNLQFDSESTSANSAATHRHDDDYIDRLHYFATSNLLTALAVLVSFRQFAGRPIECMVPDYFPGSWEQYAENYCWAQDTYFLSLDIDLTRQLKREHKISYYQWVPFFLLIEACCFRVPSLIWKYLAGHSGIRIHDIVRVAVDERNIQSDVKQSNLKALTVHLQNALRFHRRLHRKRITPHKFIRVLNLPYTAVYVTCTYLFTKVLYLINVWAQLLIMNKFLHTDKYRWYGWGAMEDLLSGAEWKTSGMFPRVTLCDFEVRGMGNLQNHSVQCVLVINIFNEKIFIFLWFWYMILTLLTTGSLLYWACVTMFPWPARWFVTRHLELSEMPFDPKSSAKDVERFVTGYLKTDGVFVLRMITMHSGIIFGTDLVLELWRSFYGIEHGHSRTHDPAYLTPTPTGNENIANVLRQRHREDQKAFRSSEKSAPSKKSGTGKATSLVEAACRGSSKQTGVVLIPSAPADLNLPDSKSTTLEASSHRSGSTRRPVKELKLVMPVDSDEEEDDDNVSVQEGDVEKGVPLLPRSRTAPAPAQRTSL